MKNQVSEQLCFDFGDPVGEEQIDCSEEFSMSTSVQKEEQYEVKKIYSIVDRLAKKEEEEDKRINQKILSLVAHLYKACK